VLKSFHFCVSFSSLSAPTKTKHVECIKFGLLICCVGADAIEWFMDNMVGISTVEQAQVSTQVYWPEILYILTSLNVHTACR